MGIKELLKGASTVKLTAEAKYFTEGRYLVKILRVKEFSKRDGTPLVGADFQIVETTDPANHPVGEVRNWAENFRFPDKTQKKLIRFFAAAHKVDLDNPDVRAKFEKDVQPNIEPHLEAMTKEPCPVAGKMLLCEVKNDVNEESGKIYGVCSFRPAP